MLFSGDDVQQQCLELAAQQSQGSSAAAMFVASWMVDPLYSTLTVGLLINLSTPGPNYICFFLSTLISPNEHYENKA